MTRVVIIGGGFGGLFAAKALASAPVAVTLVDRENHHLFQPLLYQVATAVLSPADIASPTRWILRRTRNVRVLLAEARRVDLAQRRIHLEQGTLDYDFAIVAAGTTHAYFGHDEWRPHAPGLKTLADALHVRRQVLMAFERAERTTDVDERRRLLSFVIVGGGPTGVELAGAVAEICRHTLARDFRTIAPTLASVILIEGDSTILSSFPERLRLRAERDLLRLGVLVRKHTRVTHIEDGVVVAGNERFLAGVVLWAAGVAASPLGKTLGVPLDRVGRVLVEPDLSVPGHPEVFVIGDLAALNGADGKPLPGVAQVAMQQARHAARTIRATLAGRARTPFRYRDPGNLATIGRAAAIADFGWVTLTGWTAWVVWLFVHILNLQGARNRLVVLVQWAWAYVTWQRSGRLITGDEQP